MGAMFWSVKKILKEKKLLGQKEEALFCLLKYIHFNCSECQESTSCVSVALSGCVLGL